MFQYKAKVIRWVDGDTLLCMIDLGFYTHKEERLRLGRIDTPEMRGPERPEGIKATAEVNRLCPVGSEVLIESKKRDRYGRFIAEIFFGDMNINQQLIDTGFAEEVKY